jgi:diguanylate cyclase (GGDEF)-like protein
MARSIEQPGAAIRGVQPRDEHELRVWTPIAMWLAGGCIIFVGTLLPGEATQHIAELRGLAAFGVLAAIFTFVVFRAASNEALYVLTNVFSALGAVSVWLAVLWTGGPSSGLTELYFFPALYDAYFFRPRDVVWHLVLNSLLALSPLLYAGSLQGTQFPGHIAMLVCCLWGMSAVVAYRKRRLLRAELTSRQLSLSDPLTGLHNLRSLRERAEQHPPGEGTAVLVIDIDDFKAINSEYGHTGADALLRRAAAELLAVSEEQDCVARIGGDEFAILMHRRTASEVRALAGDCVRAVGRARSRAGSGGRALSASVGYALAPEDGGTLSDLLDAADREMFYMKATRRREGSTDAEDLAPDPSARLGRQSQPGTGQRVGPVHDRSSEIRERPRRAGRVRGWREARPPKSLAAATAWATASASTLLVIHLPGAESSHPALVAGLIAGAATVAAAMFLLAPALGEPAYLMSDVLAIPAIGLAVYFTGGTMSPLLPLIFLIVTFAAYFATPRGAVLRLLVVVALCASPFVYATGDARLQFLLRFVASATTAVVLVGIILYNRRKLAQAEAAALELASHDPLTGLPNRRAFRQCVTGALEAGGDAGALSVAMIDLDNFKRVNDNYGHAAGDAVLQAIAAALSATVRPTDCLARVGGDEFALVAHGVDMPASRALGIRCVAAVEEAVERIGYADCGVSATVGCALHPHHGSSLDELLEAADAALMHAKDTGKRRVDLAAVRAPSPPGAMVVEGV